MLKLYRLTPDKKEYWETWEDRDDHHLVHWGVLGETGETKTVKSTFLSKATSKIQKEVDALVKEGFRPIAPEDHHVLLIEFAVDGMGSRSNIEKRHRLEDRMNQTLGWAGLGACDGGSIGSGTIEVCNFVVDFEIAKNVIERDLLGTEFSDFIRICGSDST